MSKINRLTFCFGTSKCISETFLLMDESSLQPVKRAKKLLPSIQVEKVLAKIDSFGRNKGTSDVSQTRKR
jgi:hypothetical protein